MKLIYEGELRINSQRMKAYRYGRVGINVSHENYMPEFEKFDMQPGDDLIMVSMVAPLGYHLSPDDKDTLLQKFGINTNRPVHSFQKPSALIGVPMKFFVQVVDRKTPMN
jgi:hypothetical protein